MKQRMNKFIVSIVIPMLLIAMVYVKPVSANESLGIHVDAAILIDADNGKILYEENANEPLGIASMTKMMTEYLLFEAIDEGKVSWDDTYTVDEYLNKISIDSRLSNVPLRLGSEYTILELYEALAIYSANAATMAIAEKIAGSEAAFVEMMNKKAEELGLTDYKYVNSTGLNNSHLQGFHVEGTGENDENVMPAKSVAKLAYHLIHDFPEVLDTTKITTKTFQEGPNHEIKMDNWNFMLPGLIFEYEGVDGLKTGTTDFAGHSFTGTAKRSGKRLIAVVMKAVDAKGEGSYKARFDATKVLFDYGFSQFSEMEVVPAGYQFEDVKTLDVSKGKEKTVKIAVKSPLSTTIKTNDKELYTPELVIDESMLTNGKLVAPLKKDTVIGHVKLVYQDGEDYGFIEGEELTGEVVITEDVEKANWFKLGMRATGAFFVNVWGSATSFVKGLFK